MAAPTLHHLGLSGWHEGVEPLADTLITFERMIEPGVINPDRPLISYMITWRAPEVSADNINALMNQYPREANIGAVADVTWQVVE